MIGSRWAEVLKEHQDFDVVAYVSRSEDRRDRLRESLQLKEFNGFSSFSEALRAVEADLAIVATPSYLHYDGCQEALEHGLSIIVEKPLETDWNKAKAIVAEAARRGRLLMVGQNYRFTAPLRTLKTTLQSGSLGQAGFATVIHHRNRPGAGTYTQQMPNPMLLDMSIHHLDSMRYVFEREALSVLAHSWNPGWSDFVGDANVDALIEFENDLWLTYSGSNVSRGITIPPVGNWRIECGKGGLYLESSGFDLALFQVPLGAEPKYREEIQFCSMPRENQAYLLDHFKDCLQNGTEPETSGQDNLKSLAIAMAAIASNKRGERVYLREFLD
jgi:predicted dehydrogenase